MDKSSKLTNEDASRVKVYFQQNLDVETILYDLIQL